MYTSHGFLSPVGGTPVVAFAPSLIASPFALATPEPGRSELLARVRVARGSSVSAHPPRSPLPSLPFPWLWRPHPRACAAVESGSPLPQHRPDEKVAGPAVRKERRAVA